MGVVLDIRGSAAIVALEWPASRNALGPGRMRELAHALQEASEAEGVSAVVLTGAGTSFCAGGDLGEILSITDGLEPTAISDVVYEDFHSVVRALRAIPVPTIAAVNGPAIGLGMDLALACDIRILGTDGYLLQGWAQIGLVTGTGGVGFLNALAPGLTWDLLSRPRRLDALTSETLGLAHRAEDALREALSRADGLAALPGPALRAYVRLERGLRWPSDELLRRCAVEQGELLASAEFRSRAGRLLERT